jgi:beta-fructofuranosidase
MRFDHDPHRPSYHFMPPTNWINDPNGLIYWKEQYHLFYQHNPSQATWGNIHWGHAVSNDLVSWMHLPIALTPTPGGADEDGCWSGCIVNNQAAPTLFYTGVRGDIIQAASQSVCMATNSVDDLITWEKSPDNPIISCDSLPLDLIGFRDPNVWQEDNVWYMTVGAGADTIGGAILLYTSPDLCLWDYRGTLLSEQQLDSHDVWLGSMWECPQLLCFGDDAVLTFSVWEEQRTYYSVYVSGTYENHRFTAHHVQKLDYGNHHCYAPQTLVDAAGRQVLFAWVQEARSVEAQQKAGWSGALTLPRVLSLDSDKRLLMEPLPELKTLRKRHYVGHTLQPTSDTGNMVSVDGLLGDTLEIEATFMPGSSGCLGMLVRCSPDKQEFTRIYYDIEHLEIGIDREQSTLNPDAGIQRDTLTGSWQPKPGEALTMRVFIDHSLIEVYVNGVCLTSRVYPSRDDSLQAFFFVEGDSRLMSVQGWELDSPLTSP